MLTFSRTMAGVAMVAVLTAGAMGQRGPVSPEEANANAKKLLAEITWHESLEPALEAAKKDGKLVFYMHMVGKIDGDT